MSKDDTIPYEDTMTRARRLMASVGLTEGEAAQLRADRDQLTARARLARRLAEQMREKADEFVRTASELDDIARELNDIARRWDAESHPSP